MQKIKSCIDRFRANHPKFPLFINAVSREALMEGTVIEITVTTPEGKNYCSNIKLKQDDMELVESESTISFDRKMASNHYDSPAISFYSRLAKNNS